MASKRTSYAGKPEGEEDNEEDEEADEEDDFHPSEGSENEMETEMLDYMWIDKEAMVSVRRTWS